MPSGDRRYFSHSTFQSASVNGGRIPVIGFHSVILNPDSVNRVNPPMTTIPKTKAEQPNKQLGNERGIAADVVLGAVTDAVPTACLNAAESTVTVVNPRRNDGEKKVVVRDDDEIGWNRCE